MPRTPLLFLASLAFFYAIFSFCCYRLNPTHWQRYLAIIMIANVAYCLLTAMLLYYFHQHVSVWGFVYFISEICVMGVLIGIEYSTIQKNEKS